MESKKGFGHTGRLLLQWWQELEGEVALPSFQFFVTGDLYATFLRG